MHIMFGFSGLLGAFIYACLAGSYVNEEKPKLVAVSALAFINSLMLTVYAWNY